MTLDSAKAIWWFHCWNRSDLGGSTGSSKTPRASTMGLGSCLVRGLAPKLEFLAICWNRWNPWGWL